MPHYFFHVRNGNHVAVDPEGAAFHDLDAAREDAILAAREIFAEKLSQGSVLADQVFEITTEDGEVVELVPFRSVLKFD